MRGVWRGPAIRYDGPPIRKKNVSLGGPTFYRCIDVITLPLLHLLVRVRLLWFVCARTRRFSQNSTVFAELDGSRSKNSTVFAEFDRSRSKNSTVFAEFDRSRSKNLKVFAGLDIIMLVVQLIHSAHSIVIQSISVKNILNHSTH